MTITPATFDPFIRYIGRASPRERRNGMTTKINLDQKFDLFDEQWRPKVIAAMNGQEIKLVKVKGEFP